MNVSRTPLNLNEYEQYDIDQAYKAYVIVINDLEMQMVEDLEYQYLQQGHKIFSSDLFHQTNGRLTLKLIVAKADMLF